jgi:hypothetical protein
MQKTEVNSRALRRLAEALLDDMTEYEVIPEEEREDVATSLVRQWLTCDGNATLFLGEEQVYLVLGRTPLGKPCVVPEPAGHGWVRQLTRDWNVSPDDLPEVLGQLNRGQSAEVLNGDGVPLRLWVDPRERRRGVEPLVGEDFRPAAARDYRRMAADELEQQFGDGLDPEEMGQLASSVARQWQRYNGHACLFLDGHRRLDFHLHERDDGTCDVVAGRATADLECSLSSLGFPSEVLPEVLTRINLGQEIEFRDGEGTPCVLWHDPEAGRIRVRGVGSTGQASTAQAPPVLCPACTAVLRPWPEGERQQTCSHCGHSVALSCRPAARAEAPPVLCPACTAVLEPWPEGERQQTCSHCGRTVALG